MLSSYFEGSLRNKLLVAFLLIGFLPYLLFLSYTLLLSEQKMLDRVIAEQFDKATNLIERINNHLFILEKDIRFLSQLDVMDDILADDIDKRISRILQQKKQDYGLDIVLSLINTEGVIVASSDDEKLLKKININAISDQSNSLHVKEKTLYMYANVYASFDENKRVGTLVLSYNLDNLEQFLIQKPHIHSFLSEPKQALHIGKETVKNLDIRGNEKSEVGEKHVLIYKQMDASLSKWYIVYAVDKEVALTFLYDFIRFMLYMAPFILIVIISVAFRYSKSLVQPILELTKTADTVVQTKDYSKHLHVKSKDEIATLTQAFNNLLQTTQEALSALERENRLRLKRFTQLIDTFNTIAMTKTQEECIDTSMHHLRELTHNKSIDFFKEKSQHSNYIDLHVSDFEKDTTSYIGSIALDIETFEDTNEQRFYLSIASMISLQLDRIRLIDKTMAASNAKSAFISNMSHELRTPLNAIIGFSQYLITYENLSEDQIDVVSNIESSAQYLLSLINEILDIAKIEAGKMEVYTQRVDLLQLVNTSYSMLYALAEDKGLYLKFHDDVLEECIYTTDSKMYKQIVLNLLSNAIKFTSEGGIDIYLTHKNNTVTLQIKDSGIGIEQEQIQALFQDFTQVENVMQKEQKGTGLGLSLSRKMANLLGGDVWLESEGNAKGSSAFFTIKAES